MHYEILVEDVSGKVALEHLLPKMVPDGSTFSIHSYRGIGHIPKGLRADTDPSKRVILNQLPRILSGYGKTFANYPEDYAASVIVICDLDRRDIKKFIVELNSIIDNCDPKPNGRFCLAIEEGEAWLLGHKEAVLTAYPNAKKSILDSYVYDSICDTWELLADVIYPGGAAALKARGRPEAGRMKSIWANEIASLVDFEENKSPSFQFLVETVAALAENEAP